MLKVAQRSYTCSPLIIDTQIINPKDLLRSFSKPLLKTYYDLLRGVYHTMTFLRFVFLYRLFQLKCILFLNHTHEGDIVLPMFELLFFRCTRLGEDRFTCSDWGSVLFSGFLRQPLRGIIQQRHALHVSLMPACPVCIYSCYNIFTTKQVYLALYVCCVFVSVSISATIPANQLKTFFFFFAGKENQPQPDVSSHCAYPLFFHVLFAFPYNGSTKASCSCINASLSANFIQAHALQILGNVQTITIMEWMTNLCRRNPVLVAVC